MLKRIILTDIKSVHVIPTKRGRYLEIASRPSYALSLCSGAGRIIYDLNGVKTISDRHNAVILPKGASYVLRNEEGGDFPIINFDTFEPITDEIIAIPLSSPESYLDDFREIERLFNLGGGTAELYAAIYSLIARLAKEKDDMHSELSPAIEYIHKNISDPELSIEDLARICNISEVYFRKLFTKHFGISPKQFIIDVRIQKAKQLLAEGALSIYVISEKCGFSNPYHFCRLFKQHTGISPSEYRKANLLYKI